MIRRHLRFSSRKQRGNLRHWKDKMQGVPCFVLGNAPSLNDEDVSELSSFFTIGINRSFLKLDTTILMWQDIELWYTERKSVIKLQSLKVCPSQADPQNRFFHFKREPGGFKLPAHPGVLHGTGTTGPLAMQFAYSLGCDPIIMLGMDCKPRGNATDFYGKNRHHKPHTMTNCKVGLKWIKNNIKDRTLICCSENDLWPRTSLADAIKGIDEKWRKDRAYYVGLLNR
jgi:hypothetical protein